MNVINGNGDKWYFWNETWTEEYGPYKTRDSARAHFAVYCLEQVDSGNYQRPTHFGNFIRMLTEANESFEFNRDGNHLVVSINSTALFFSVYTGALDSVGD